jgi:hypothetical protein
MDGCPANYRRRNDVYFARRCACSRNLGECGEERREFVAIKIGSMTLDVDDAVQQARRIPQIYDYALRRDGKNGGMSELRGHGRCGLAKVCSMNRLWWDRAISRHNVFNLWWQRSRKCCSRIFVRSVRRLWSRGNKQLVDSPLAYWIPRIRHSVGNSKTLRSRRSIARSPYQSPAVGRSQNRLVMDFTS